MKLENRATKLYLREIAPLQAIKLIEQYKIPSPYKEVLIVGCVGRKKDFEALYLLEKDYQIYLSKRTYDRRLRDGLEMFYKSHTGKI